MAQIVRAHMVDFPFFTNFWPPPGGLQLVNNMLDGRELSVSPGAEGRGEWGDGRAGSAAGSEARRRVASIMRSPPALRAPLACPALQLGLDPGDSSKTPLVGGFQNSRPLAATAADLRAGASVMHVLSL